MSVQFKDYYEILGVDRKADKSAIKKAYRRLARKFHPDVNPGDRQAEEKFKDIQEAYAVLSKPERRQQYDSLGSDWRPGADFTPPPGWRPGATRVDFGDGEDLGEMFGSRGGFSDFFESIFGGFGADARRTSRGTFSRKGSDVEASLQLGLEDVHQGTRATLSLQTERACDRCRGSGSVGGLRCPSCGGAGKKAKPRKLNVKIPPGLRDGSVIRLAGKGENGRAGGKPGDLYLRIHLKPHHRFQVVGADDLQVELPLSPWEAALGARVNVPTLDGSVELKIPPETQTGQRLRLRGQGLRTREDKRGDLFVKVKIVIPPKLNDRERELFEELARVSEFEPR